MARFRILGREEGEKNLRLPWQCQFSLAQPRTDTRPIKDRVIPFLLSFSITPRTKPEVLPRVELCSAHYDGIQTC